MCSYPSPSRRSPMSSQTATMTAATPTTPTVDPDKLMAFVFRAVEEAGAALNCSLVVMGDRLGYYRSLADHGPSTPAELAERTDTDEHYAREWLNAQAAGSFVTYHLATGRYHLPARAGRGAGGRDEPRVRRRPVPDRARNRLRHKQDRRGGPHRRRHELG